MPRKRTHEEFIKEMNRVNPNITILGKYINKETKIEYHCNVCNTNHFATPNSLLRGHGCPKCATIKQSQKSRMTHKEFIDKMKEINPDIEITGRYVLSSQKIDFRCSVCGFKHSATPNSLLSGKGCPECKRKKVSQKNSKTHEQFINEILKINPNITILGKYVNAKTKIEYMCNICGLRHFATPCGLLFGDGCPKCSKVYHKNTDEFVEEMKLINPNLTILGEYINSRTKIQYKCNICGYINSANAQSLLDGVGCPKCNHSKGEKLIAQYLDINNIIYVSQKRFKNCKNKFTLPFDFYLPQYNICIEYQGEQHFKPCTFGGITQLQAEYNLEQQQIRDKIKKKFCQENKIKLITISYKDYDNIEKILDELFSPTTTNRGNLIVL